MPGSDRLPEASVAQATDIDLSWEPEQGPHLLGAFPDTLMVIRASGAREYIRASTTPVNRAGYSLSVTASAAGANLVADSWPLHHEKDDAWFIGMRLAASDGGELKITAVTLVNPGDVHVDGVVTKASSTLYSLDYRPPLANGNLGAWVDYCGGYGGAIPLRGGYDESRIHNDGDAITFVCLNGIGLKCNFWGYVAGNGGPSTEGWKYHQACTGMGIANYCRTGQSFTRELTPIQIRDAVPGYGHDPSGPNDPDEVLTHPASMPGDPDTFYIEAGWDENGGPICLSKIRWAGLPPDPCPSVLPDPRFRNPSGDEEHPKGRFCDDWTLPELFAHGARIVNGSKAMDMRLQRWRNPSTRDEVATLRGYFIDRDHDGRPDPDSTLPFPDASNHSGYTEYLGTGGLLLRNLPGTLLESQMQPLAMRNVSSAGDHFLDTTVSRADPDFEGYSFRDQVPLTTEGLPVLGVQPLSLCAGTAGFDTRQVAPAACSGKSLFFALPSP
jgi:hypothetical protein